jgi:acyl-CoA synthetase (AMP-forming)/AMP-acid ligase II/acyl carrier protein
MSQVAGPGFDAMAFEVWPCLLNGGTLFIADEETRLDPVKMKMWLIANKITVSFQSTAAVERLLLETWPGQGVALRVLMTGGEQLGRYPRTHLPFRFYNLYGPTEDTVCTTWYEVKVPPGPPGGGEKYPPIGRPVDNHRVYIMGSYRNLQPVGAAGELCTAGEGVAVGYLNRPELTAEKFVEDPFLPGERMYKSGDLARWLSDGNLEFLGRIDSQVKIRGFRIELGEIKSRLLEHDLITDAVVTAREDTSGQRYLCAYTVSKEHLDTAVLKEFLLLSLPGYMVPAYFVFLEKIPLNANGKVNPGALPKPEIKAGEKYAPPTDELEEKLVGLWADVLGIEKEVIGIHDNFFDLGGNSLKVVQLSGRIKSVLGKDVPVLKLFRYTSISSFRNYLNEEKASPGASDEKQLETIDKGKRTLDRLKTRMRKL